MKEYFNYQANLRLDMIFNKEIQFII